MADPIAETTVVPITAAVAGAMNEGAPTDDDEASSAHEQDRTGDGPAAASPKGDVEPAPAVLPQPDAQKEQGPQSLTLKDVNVGNKDGRGFQITRIYAVQSDEYAIYQAGEVMVHFADDQGKAQAQKEGSFQ